LNPGKHRICGSSPGYEPVCKDFEVKRADALTYSLVLPLKGGAKAIPSKPKEEDEVDEEAADAGDSESSSTFIWWTLGSMGLLAVALAILFNTKD
jgi:hypothetical protein